jgi:hypothetical protein
VLSPPLESAAGEAPRATQDAHEHHLCRLTRRQLLVPLDEHPRRDAEQSLAPPWKRCRPETVSNFLGPVHCATRALRLRRTNNVTRKSRQLMGTGGLARSHASTASATFPDR